MPRLKLLICDDAVLYATMLASWLSHDAEIEVVGVASSAQEVLEQAARLEPDVIVLDHLLPDGSSAHLMPQLRAQVPSAAIVLISGLPEALLARMAADVGAQAWVPKASKIDDVRAGILRAAAAPR